MKIERNCIQMHKTKWRTKSSKFSSGAKHETSFWWIWDSQGCIFNPLSLDNQGATHMFQIVINGLHNLHPMERYMIARVENFLINLWSSQLAHAFVNTKVWWVNVTCHNGYWNATFSFSFPLSLHRL
jgi:hypothetical protein